MRLQIRTAFLKIYHMEFKDLIVYKKSLEVIAELESNVFVLTNLDKSIKDQLKRASFSITLNISEGSSRFSYADRKNYFVIARGSAFECSAALDSIEVSIKQSFPEIKFILEEISKILFKMISNLDTKINEKKVKSKKL
jgi:four helix bundle protein